MKRSIFLNVLFFCVMFFLLSCNQEEKQIQKMEKLVQKVEKNPESLTAEDWEKLEQEYEEITTKMQNYTYTEEDLERIGYLQGRFAAEATKIAFKELMKGAQEVSTQVQSGIKGFIDGFGEDLESLEEELKVLEEDTQTVEE